MSKHNRPLVLALHGWGARGAFFADLARRLEGCCEFIAPDLIGHGSLQAVDDVSLSAHAKQIDEIFRLHKDRNKFLIGWSMGAAAALTYIDEFGADGITGLIIEDMGPKPLNQPDWDLGIGNGYSCSDVEETVSKIRLGWSHYGRRVWRATFADPSVAKDFELDPLFEAFLDNQEVSLENAWRSLMEFDARALIGSLSIPVLAIMGAQSHVYGKSLADWYESQLPAATVLRLEGAGHAPHLEQPEAFALAVEAFIQTHR